MTLFLHAGDALTITADAVSGGTVRRLPESAGAGTQYPAAAIAVSTTTVVGPFSNGRGYEILCEPGLLTYSVAKADIDLRSPALLNPTADTLPAKDVVTAALVNGAVPIAPGTVAFTKAGVAAMTLAAPTAAQAGTIMRFTAGTANAHTLTATGLIQDGIAGGAKDLATFAAFVGASLTLEAINLKWHVLSLNACVVS